MRGRASLFGEATTPKLATCFVSSPSTSSIPVNRAAWLQHIDRGYVLGFIVSPPCESWSRARLHGGVAGWSKGDGGPRVVRTEEAPEGLFAMTAPEQQQVLLGNRLLCFIMLAFVHMLRISRFAMVEHPASSAAASEAWLASIWKLFLTKVFQANEFVWKVDIYQGLFGAKSPKPTSLLFSVGPSIDVRAILEKGQTVEEMPRQLEMGWDRQAGEYQTASLKNYPGGLCAAISCVCQQWLECYLPEVPPSDADHCTAVPSPNLYTSRRIWNVASTFRRRGVLTIMASSHVIKSLCCTTRKARNSETVKQ